MTLCKHEQDQGLIAELYFFATSHGKSPLTAMEEHLKDKSTANRRTVLEDCPERSKETKWEGKGRDEKEPRRRARIAKIVNKQYNRVIEHLRRCTKDKRSSTIWTHKDLWRTKTNPNMREHNRRNYKSWPTDFTPQYVF